MGSNPEVPGFAGKLAVISGGSRKIGLTTAQAFLEAGAKAAPRAGWVVTADDDAND